MNIIHGFPPNFEEIAKVFPSARNYGVVFAYANTVYIPSGRKLSPSLAAHEDVHLERQGRCIEGAEEWWGKYLSDDDFRYNEEVLAHRAEYLKLIEEDSSRANRRRAIGLLSKRLCSPLYGKMVTSDKAKQDILRGI